METGCDFGVVRCCERTGECAGAGDCAWGKPGRGWRAGDSGLAGGFRRAIFVVSRGNVGRLAPVAARDANRDSVWRYAAASHREDAGERTAATYFFRGCCRQRNVSPDWRGLHGVLEGYRRRRMGSVVPLRRYHWRRDAADRWHVAELAGTLVVAWRSDRVYVHTADWEGHRLVGDESGRSEERSFAHAIGRRRLAAAGLVPGRQEDF